MTGWLPINTHVGYCRHTCCVAVSQWNRTFGAVGLDVFVPPPSGCAVCLQFGDDRGHLVQ